MKTYLDPTNNYCCILSHYKRDKSWIEVPEGAEVLTGLKLDKYSQVFWKPSEGEVWANGRFAKYWAQDSVSYEEYIDRWVTNLVLWRKDNV